MGSISQWAAIWDVDGTLVDTAELHFAAWVRLCEEFRRPFTREDFAATFGKRNQEILSYLFGSALPGPQVNALGERKEGYYRTAAQHGVELLPGAAELLTNLAAAGVPQAIGSSAPHSNLDLILALTATAQFFDAVVSMEDTNRGKPDPEVFQIAAKRLKVAPERCVVFEDAVAGVQAAKTGGMKCVAVTFVGHHPADKLRDAGADLVVSTLNDVSLPILVRIIGG